MKLILLPFFLQELEAHFYSKFKTKLRTVAASAAAPNYASTN